MRIREILKFGLEVLDKRNNATLDCELILANVIGVEREYLIAHPEEQIAQDLFLLFEQYLKRVVSGEPVAYILNEKEFYGLNFYVDKRVLVPRPETELLVEKVLNFVRKDAKDERTFRIIDVGTGSGNIAVALAKILESEFPGLLEGILALDIQEGAMEVAKINVEQFGLEDKIQVCQSDLLEVIEEGENYDVIVANLPYIGEVKNRVIEENVEKFEPGSALFGGDDGLELYKKLFQQIDEKRLSPKLIVGEFAFGQKEDLERLLNKYFEHRWNIEKDLAGVGRMFVVQV